MRFVRFVRFMRCALMERTLYAGDDERAEDGIGNDDERGERPEILSVEEKMLCFAEPPSPRTPTELHNKK